MWIWLFVFNTPMIINQIVHVTREKSSSTNKWHNWFHVGIVKSGSPDKGKYLGQKPRKFLEKSKKTGKKYGFTVTLHWKIGKKIYPCP